MWDGRRLAREMLPREFVTRRKKKMEASRRQSMGSKYIQDNIVTLPPHHVTLKQWCCFFRFGVIREAERGSKVGQVVVT